MTLAESQFLKTLRSLARVAGRDLNADGLELYNLLVLDTFGDERSTSALLGWVRTNQRASFPTPGELLALLQPEASPRTEAAELASRIIAAIGRRGYTWSSTFHYDGHATFADAVRNELGGAALAFCERMGGWHEVCRQFGADGSIASLRAQLRDAIEPLVAQHASQKLLGTQTRPNELGQKRGGELVRVSEIKGVA